MRRDVGFINCSILQKGNGFLIAITTVACLTAGGCTSFGQTKAPDPGGSLVSVKDVSDDAVRARLEADGRLFEQVMLQEGLDETTLKTAWMVYQTAPGAIDTSQTEFSEQRKLLSQALPTTRRSLIKTLMSGQAKSTLLRVGRFVIQRVAEYCHERQPRIHAIQAPNVVRFQDADSANPDQIIQIPIEGKDLHPYCVDLQVVVIGKTFQQARTEIPKYLDLIKPTESNPDGAFIVLKNEYLKTLASGDRLDIHVMISQHDFVPTAESIQKDKRVVSYATRTITFYSDRDYKDKVLSTRVPSHDIEAFPLPDVEVEKIYGPLVSDNFYVVDLSIRNRNGKAKLVNTGMVIASGRAIVVKVEKMKMEIL